MIAIATVFLVLLYNSPSGLVFYWTLNNLFSLGKNIAGKICKAVFEEKKELQSGAFDRGATLLFFLSSATLAILSGVMIPSDVISKNPLEIINRFTETPVNPAVYVLRSAVLSFGVFLLWIPLFYLLSVNKTRKLISRVTAAFAIFSAVNYVFFNRNFGLLSGNLIYENEMAFTPSEILLDLLLVLICVTAVLILSVILKKAVMCAIAILLCVTVMLSVLNISRIKIITSQSNYLSREYSDNITVPMSSNGKNVVIIIMDRMMSVYLPYIFNERPDVKTQFEGFTYYPNTISFGLTTNTGVPALFGGYEYTPSALNAREDTLLVDKHNEAVRVLPQIFSDDGWNVYVGDISYANYQWIPDLSIYDYNDRINAYNLSGAFNDRSAMLVRSGIEFDNRLNRNLFCYGLMKILPYALQDTVYAAGSYGTVNSWSEADTTPVTFTSHHIQDGIPDSYLAEYTVLDALPEITTASGENENCFFMFCNSTTHEALLLNEPEYTPSEHVDNTEFDMNHMDRFTVDGHTMNMDDPFSYAHYECNMAACIALGKWFDYLRDNNIFDNTRIIIVADHGHELYQFEDLYVDNLEFDAQGFNPILLVKDFYSDEYSISYDFMTNADTPSIAMAGIIENPVNPFTNNPIAVPDKGDEQLVYYSHNYDILVNNGTQFEDPDGYWLTVHDNIYDDDNWDFYDGE